MLPVPPTWGAVAVICFWLSGERGTNDQKEKEKLAEGKYPLVAEGASDTGSRRLGWVGVSGTENYWELGPLGDKHLGSPGGMHKFYSIMTSQF